MGKREIENFNRNAADFMARFGVTDRCQCVQCVKTRREGVIEGLGMALDMNQSWDAVTWAAAIKREIERLRAEQKEG